MPDIEKEGFQARLRAAIGDAAQPQTSAQPTGQSSSAATTGTTAPVPASESVSASSSAPVAASTPISPTPGPAAPRAQPVQSQQQPQQKREEAPAERKPEKLEQPQTPSAKSIKKPATQKKDPAPAPKISINKQDKPAQSSRGMKVEMPTSPPSKSDQEPAPKPQPTPPRQYRLQVRLFDGSSVRSSFTPTQTIRGDVRPWVDNQLEEKRPYNLKHILTPLPNRTLTIAEEEQTLEELGLGSTANLVMVPINTYTEAYSTSGASLPVRAVSSAYGIVSSVVGTATGLVGSLFGYTQPAPAAQTAPSAGSQAENTNTAGAARPRPTGSGLNIRTLHDRRESRDDSQLYNGNQVCVSYFEFNLLPAETDCLDSLIFNHDGTKTDDHYNNCT